MRAWELQGGFGIDNLVEVDRPVKQSLQPGQVRVRLHAASLNYRDLLMVTGRYNPRQPLPLIPLSDGCGEVIEIAEGVDRCAVGDRVLPTFAQRWIAGEPERSVIRHTLGGPLDGTLAEEIVLSAEGLVAVPSHLSDVEGATLPCAALTAWSALVTTGNVHAGDTVLVMGTGGVSLFACAFAKALGAGVIATSSDDHKLERVLELGADEAINYRTTPDWGQVAKERTAGRGVDLVVEVGGASTLPQSLRAVRPGGTIAMIGNLGSGVGEVNVLSILMNQVRVQGVLVGHREGFEQMNRAIVQHRIRPVVDRVFPFKEAPHAFEHLSSAKHFGKVCIEV